MIYAVTDSPIPLRTLHGLKISLSCIRKRVNIKAEPRRVSLSKATSKSTLLLLTDKQGEPVTNSANRCHFYKTLRAAAIAQKRLGGIIKAVKLVSLTATEKKEVA